MPAAETLLSLTTAIDEHRWGDLAPLLDADFTCRYVHTGETLDRDGWVRLNAEYPGFERLVVETSSPSVTGQCAARTSPAGPTGSSSTSRSRRS